MLTLMAPAKLNLTLEVVAKRPDGFHEIRSVVQTINLCDNLSLSLSQSIEFRCAQPEWIAEQSLVAKAATLLQQATRCSKGAIIGVHKCIPLLAGLGGDSSDAAATLRGLDKLWELRLPPGKLAELASRLGSDVAFFLFGGTALAQGRGELISPLPSLPHMWAVLLIPPVPRIMGKTGRLYASLRPAHFTEGQITDRLVASLTRSEEVATANLFNVFDSVADKSFVGLGKYRRQFLKAGAREVHLAGSGPALFTLIKDRVQAEKLYNNLQQKGLESYLVETLTAIDQVG